MKRENEHSIHDVAERAGVSISTVSRVMNGLDRVAPSTRRSVLRAIRELKYRPNPRARALSRKRTDLIGLILPDYSGDYYGRLMEGVDEMARWQGLHLAVTRAKDVAAKFEAIDHLLVDGRVDGLILMIAQDSGEVLDRLDGVKSPIVVIDKDVEHRHLDNVLVDNRTGCRMATEHLIHRHGLGNLLFIGGPPHNIDSHDRAQGFKDALLAAGITPTDAQFFETDYSYDSGIQIARKLANRFQRGERWGIVAGNDDIAHGIISVLTAQGLDVPGDIAIIGHDDSRLARLSHPALTSVRLPLRELGHSAVKLLLERLKNPESRASKIILKGDLTVRASCGCAVPAVAKAAVT